MVNDARLQAVTCPVCEYKDEMIGELARAIDAALATLRNDRYATRVTNAMTVLETAIDGIDSRYIEPMS